MWSKGEARGKRKEGVIMKRIEKQGSWIPLACISRVISPVLGLNSCDLLQLHQLGLGAYHGQAYPQAHVAQCA